MCRFQKSPSDPIFKEIDADLYLKSVTLNNFNMEEEREKLMENVDLYDYAPIFFDLKDIAVANSVDETHTSVRLYSSLIYILRVPFDKYFNIYQTLIGVAINDFSGTNFENIETDATVE